jgi:hypothetical protein
VPRGFKALQRAVFLGFHGGPSSKRTTPARGRKAILTLRAAIELPAVARAFLKKGVHQ